MFYAKKNYSKAADCFSRSATFAADNVSYSISIANRSAAFYETNQLKVQTLLQQIENFVQL